MMKTFANSDVCQCRGRTGAGQILLVCNRGNAGLGRTVKRTAKSSGRDQGLDRPAVSGTAVSLDADVRKAVGVKSSDPSVSAVGYAAAARRPACHQEMKEHSGGSDPSHAKRTRPDKAILSDPSCLHQQRALAMARHQDSISSPLPGAREAGNED